MTVTAMYFDDFPLGWSHEVDLPEMSLETITGFAREWDPQPFHIDPDAAKDSPYGGIIASGWHTLLAAFLAWYQTGLWAEASMGSPGMEEVRWLKPVRPGDRLRVRMTVTKAVPSTSRPDRGRVTFLGEIFNQDDQKVAEYSGVNILRRRQAE